MTTTRFLPAGLLLIAFAAVSLAGSTPFVKLLGDRLPAGAEMVVVVDSLPIGAGNFRIVLRSPDGSFQILDQFVADTTGEYMATIALPEVAPGAYTIEIDNAFQVFASTPLEVLPALSLDVSPDSAFGGQSIAFQVAGVQPGQVTITADGIPVQGPLDVDQGHVSGTFRLPNGASGPIIIEARNFFGSRTLGSANAAMRRTQSTGDAVSVLSVQIPAGPLVVGESFEVTGQVQMPDGLDPREAKWTLVWIRHDAARETTRSYPINTRAIAMDGAGNFTATATIPSALNHGPVGEFDEIGLLYELPRIGGSGGQTNQVALGSSPATFTGPAGSCPDLMQTLTIEVNDGAGLLLEDAVVSIETGAYLYPPEEAGTRAGFSKGSSVSPTNTTAFSVFDSVGEAQVPTFSPIGCPASLANGVTDANGRFSFSFSPQAMSILYQVAQLDLSSGAVKIKDVDPEVRFSVRTFAGHLGFGPDNQAADGVTGKRFDFSFNAVDCKFRFAETLDGPFNKVFDPDAGPFQVALPPNDKPIKINSNPRVEGLSHSIVNDTVIIEGLRTFYGLDDVHQPSDYLVSISPTRFQLPYNAQVFGSLGQVEMFINDQSVGFMSPDVQDTCEGSNFDYVLDVPGLHLMAPGTYDARIEAQRQDSPGAPATKDFKIEIAQVNSWFDSPDYESVFVAWKPEKISITAFESEQTTDASSDDPALEENQIGPLDNNNKTQAPQVYQELLAGQDAGQISRMETTQTTFAGQSEDQTTRTPLLRRPLEEMLSEPIFRSSHTKRDELFARGDPWFGSHDPLVLFETGKIPLFRYSWGAAPLAAATFGADFWFLLQLTYFGYVDIDLGNFLIEASAFVEPAVQAGLDVFFDLSILFGIASATVSATPSINVGMPILVYKNDFISEESGPCFKFLLDVAYKLTLGFCDLCIEAKDTANLLDISEPEACQITGVGTRAKAVAQNIPVADKTGVSYEATGDGLTISAASDGIFVNRVAGPYLLQQWQLTGAPGAMRPAIAHLGLNSAVAVWSQSGLSPAEFDSLVTTPVDGSTFGGFAAGSQAQHMAYSVFDGQNWSAPGVLTVPTGTGEGDVFLAACPKEDPDCPANGEVLAVWARDMAGDMEQQQFKLMYAFFDGVSWTTPAMIDSGSTAKDSQPTAAYVGGEPVVMWVRNPSASATAMNMHSRRLWYQFPRQAAGPLEAINLPESVASPTLSSFSNGTLVAAFSVSDDQALVDRTFLGPKRALWTAFGTDCMAAPAGECFWGGQQREDVFGRKIYVERPQLVIDENDNATVAFRQFGFSGSPRPEDAIGVITGTGDLATLSFQLGTEFSQVGQLSNDGLVNWEVSTGLVPGVGAQTVLNGKAGPSLDQFAFRALDKSTAPAPPGVLRRPLGAAAGRGAGSDARQIFISQTPRLPDLAIASARSDSTRLEPGAPLTVFVEVTNLGVALPAGTSVLLSATWFGGYGTGQEGGELIIDNIAIGERKTVEFELDAPAELMSDERRSLFLTINPLHTIREITAANNVAEVAFGALPVPSGLAVYGNGKEPFNYLQWNPVVGDGRVTAYRIYRRDSNGEVEAIGSSPVAGYADILLDIDESYEYRLTSMSERLIESEPSEWVRLPRLRSSDLIFADGFESSP